MEQEKVLALIEDGEGLKIEFKQRFSSYEKMAKEMIAFANTRGGWLLVGVNDNGTIKGVRSEKEEAALIREAAENYCVPPISYDISFIEVNGKEIVAVYVHESYIKPVRLQDYLDKFDIRSAVVYVRVGEKSIGASKEMIKILQDSVERKPLTNYSLGKTEKIVFDHLNKNETITVKELGDLANISRRRASRTLIKLVRADLLLIHSKDNGEDYFTSAG